MKIPVFALGCDVCAVYKSSKTRAVTHPDTHGKHKFFFFLTLRQWSGVVVVCTLLCIQVYLIRVIAVLTNTRRWKILFARILAVIQANFNIAMLIRTCRTIYTSNRRQKHILSIVGGGGVTRFNRRILTLFYSATRFPFAVRHHNSRASLWIFVIILYVCEGLTISVYISYVVTALNCKRHWYFFSSILFNTH